MGQGQGFPNSNRDSNPNANPDSNTNPNPNPNPNRNPDPNSNNITGVERMVTMATGEDQLNRTYAAQAIGEEIWGNPERQVSVSVRDIVHVTVSFKVNVSLSH
jgi:hypothetical protein